MILTERFAFLHLHKSGGTFVNRALLEHVPGARRVGYHLPRADIPVESRSLPVLGTVRNPWDYYVSWCAFQSGLPQPNAVFRVVSHGGRLGFEATLSNLVRLGEDASLFDAVQSALPETRPGNGLNLSRADLAPLRGSGVGFYSFLYARLFRPGDSLVKVDALRERLPAALESLGEPLTPALRQYIATAPPVNASAHGHYSGYYGPAARDLVGRLDSALIAAHQFSFAAGTPAKN